MQHINQVRTFLSRILRLVIESNAVSDQQFCAIATPHVLGQKLAAFPEQRAAILHATTGLKLSNGQKRTPEQTASILADEIAEHETNLDPTQSVQGKIRSAVPFDDWPLILDEELVWKIILSSGWYHQTDEGTVELTVLSLKYSTEGLLEPNDFLTAIGPTTLAEKLPNELARKVLAFMLTDANALERTNPETIWQIVSAVDLVRTFGPEYIVTNVLGFAAKKHGFVKDKPPQVSSTGLTPPPPPVSIDEDPSS